MMIPTPECSRPSLPVPAAQAISSSSSRLVLRAVALSLFVSFLPSSAAIDGVQELPEAKGELPEGPVVAGEDHKLRDYIVRYGHGCWSAVPVKAGLQRNGKSCRLRWINYLRPGLKHGVFSREERYRDEPARYNGQERAIASRPASSDSSEPVESSSADDSSCLTEPAAVPVRPHAPVIPKVMFSDWFDMHYGTSLAGMPPCQLDAAFDAQGMSHQCSSVDSLHGQLGDGGFFWTSTTRPTTCKEEEEGSPTTCSP
ncbi:hypothetical protein GUJ93_ZPchr0014g46541 [Zizania palustris]|uniref:Uncharacterized protein n=1 Tax=Zizania palustris TaxID=103762 RepID=A0A8J5TBY3_ZIZPA|nr:hypothetical protein GUJ93_ZPchr0014g46541 [Zizania palustris]